MTRRRSTSALIGLPPGEVRLPLFDVVANCITKRDSFFGTRQDMAETLALAADGRVRAAIDLQPLAAINEMAERLQQGDVPSRLVFEFGPTRLDIDAASA